MSLTFELSVFFILAAAMVASWIDVRVSAGKLAQKVDDHHRASDKFWEEVKAKLKEDTNNYSTCRLGFSKDISSVDSRVILSEAHHQENKAILMELKGSIVDLYKRLDSFLSGDFIEIIKGETGAKGSKGEKGEKKD